MSPTAAQVAAHEAGYEANFEGVLRSMNPHPAGSDEHRAWDAGHEQAADTRREWEEANFERCAAA